VNEREFGTKLGPWWMMHIHGLELGIPNKLMIEKLKDMREVLYQFLSKMKRQGVKIASAEKFSGQ
jgi:hypothetical protein